MKKQILSILLCALCVACNDFEEETGYTLNVGPFKITVDEVSTTSYSGVYQIPISLANGKADISKVYFNVNNERVEAKCEKEVYSMDYQFVCGKRYDVRTIAVINGIEQTLDKQVVGYSISDLGPSGKISCTVVEFGKIRFTVNLSSSASGYFPLVSDVTITTGSLTTPMQSAGSQTYVCDVDLYDIKGWGNKALVKVKTKLGTTSLNFNMGSTGVYIRVYNVTDYDMSNDGKEMDGCIYLAGTKWAKGVMGSDGKLTADSELGESWNSYPFSFSSSIFDGDGYYYFQGMENDPIRKNLGEGWMTPSTTQLRNLYERCSIQKVKVGNNTGYLFYPGKNGKRVLCNVAYSSADVKELRERGVYMQENEYYASDMITKRPSYTYAWVACKIESSSDGFSFDYPWCNPRYCKLHILPIKE